MLFTSFGSNPVAALHAPRPVAIQPAVTVWITAQNDGILTNRVTAIALRATAPIPAPRYSWTGPKGFTSLVQAPVVTIAGLYTVTVSNGKVTGSASFIVADNRSKSNGIAVVDSYPNNNPHAGAL